MNPAPTIYIHKAEPIGNFTRIDNTMMRDPSMSVEARFLLAYFSGLPSDWRPDLKDIARVTGWGRDKTSRIFRQLERRGHAKLVTAPLSATGKHQGSFWHIFQNPADSTKIHGKKLKYYHPPPLPPIPHNLTHNINYRPPENQCVGSTTP